MKELWITKHGGKMKGIDSISTSCLVNPFCQQRQCNKDMVCSKCYSKKYLTLRPSLREKMLYNTELLTSRILTDDELPLLNAAIFRFESFGDLINETQLQNYINICLKNKRTTFALWTKNPWTAKNIFNAMKIEKPENLIIILSSPLLNEQVEITDDMWFVDHVFTVYTKKYAKDNGIDINCGAKNCLKCQLCYQKGTEFYINEILK